MGDKVKAITDYQARQKTPEEALVLLQEEIENGNVENLLITYVGGKGHSTIHASKNRDYKNSEVLWDLEQCKLLLLAGD